MMISNSRPISAASNYSAFSSLSKTSTSVLLSNKFVSEFDEEVTTIQWAPKEASPLLACATPSCLYILRKSLAPQETSEFNFKIIRKFPLKTSCVNIAWSNDSMSTEDGDYVKLACALDNSHIEIFQDLDEPTMFMGHTDYINSLAFSVYEEDSVLFASTGDDKTLRLWYKEFEQRIVYLENEGILVSFHPLKRGILLLGEQNGNVRLYNSETLDVMANFSTGQEIMFFDWSVVSTGERLAILTENDGFIWKFVDDATRVELVGRVSGHKHRLIKWSENANYFAVLPSISTRLRGKIEMNKSLTQLISPIYIFKSSYFSHVAYELAPHNCKGLVYFDNLCWSSGEGNLLAATFDNKVYFWTLGSSILQQQQTRAVSRCSK